MDKLNNNILKCGLCRFGGNIHTERLTNETYRKTLMEGLIDKMFHYFNIYKEEITRITRFCIVGLLNTTVFFLLFFLFFNIISLNYLLSSTIAYLLATVNSFMINRSWTFESYGEKNKKFIKFVIVNLVSIGVNSLMIFILVELFCLHPWLAQFLTICVTTCINYTGNRFWTFK